MKGVDSYDDGESYDNDMSPAFGPLFSIFYRRGGDSASGFPWNLRAKMALLLMGKMPLLR